MERSNLGICNQCKARVPAEFFTRDGQIWIRKDCPACGPNEALVSTDAEAWQAKRELWPVPDSQAGACSMNCDRCRTDHRPGMVFVDVTNRCNMNCPICIATIRDMGFDFNPPLEYFRKIFAELGRMDPKPTVQFFGGEPTVRADLLEIYAAAREHGLRAHVVTNGLRLADEDYCRRLCEARVPLRLAFDGRSPDIYEKLRHNRAAYDKKMQALANLKKFSRRKHTIIATIGLGFNDQYVADLLQFVHDNRDLIADVGMIPLTENWRAGEFEVSVHTTMEDVEKVVQDSVPGGVDFIPTGMSYALKQARSFFRKDPRSEVLMLAGVHPNCESMTILVSDGKTYRGMNHYLTKPLKHASVEFVELAKKMEPKLSGLDPRRFWQRQRGRLVVIRTVAPWLFRTVRVWRLGLFRRLAGFAWRRLFHRHGTSDGSGSRRPRPILRVAMLPFEEQHSIDAERLRHCKAVFAYEDTDDGKVKYFPACAWYPYRNPLLEKISRKYGVAPEAAEEEKAGQAGK